MHKPKLNHSIAATYNNMNLSIDTKQTRKFQKSKHKKQYNVQFMMADIRRCVEYCYLRFNQEYFYEEYKLLYSLVIIIRCYKQYQSCFRFWLENNTSIVFKIISDVVKNVFFYDNNFHVIGLLYHKESCRLLLVIIAITQLKG